MPWKIWFEVFRKGKKIGSGVWTKSYKHKCSAVRYARQNFDKPRVGAVLSYKWIVSQTNPYRKGE